MNYYVAIDIGASSGRVMLSQLKNNQIKLDEIYRFKNEFVKENGFDTWNIQHLIESILIGLEKIKHMGIDQCTVGIDTWGVDYCLVNEEGQLVRKPISYRDDRTNDILERFEKKLPLEELYERTGIQIQPFNTIFQLITEESEAIKQAKHIMLIPDYLAFVFTDTVITERTNASTTQLVNSKTGDWDLKLLEMINISIKKLPPIKEVGTVRGKLKHEKFKKHNLPDATFINVGSHDTASAVAGIPATKDENWLFLSSGTWSLLGKEMKTQSITKDAFKANYTNEVGVYERFRFLKNIMGMWLIQEVARNFDYQFTYQEIVEKASESPAFQQFINVNNPIFLNPDNMYMQIQEYCEQTGQKVPQTIWEVARCIFDSLALSYAVEIKLLGQLIEEDASFDTLYIVGGGANNQLLNQLTANLTQMKVVSGPTEATALGNIVVQMITQGDLKDLNKARKVIMESSELQIFYPEKIDLSIIENYEKFLKEYET
ncbi:rhamnulokinase [Fundicoccus sp. Sow4_F4]|uniref:rhamnulokinase n=1 Tax=Fundicoccus sp. Sow4_F4 TaxID=3438783 RepID=UPI003F91C0B4